MRYNGAMENELETNAKNLSQKEQHLLRKSIVRLLKQGIASRAVADMLGVSRSLVYATKKAYDEKGIEGIKPGRRGRRQGAKRSLSPEQERGIRDCITDNAP